MQEGKEGHFLGDVKLHRPNIASQGFICANLT